MSMKSLTANLDRGAHHEAQKAQIASMGALATKIDQKRVAGQAKEFHAAAQRLRDDEDTPVTANRWLSAYAEADGVYPSEDELKAAESYWMRRFKVNPETDILREEKVREYARERWTIDAIMQACGVQPRGRGASTVQKAFDSSTVQVIFPFYYSAAIQAGILASPILDRIIMEDIPVNSHTADHAAMQENVGDRSTTLTAEAARPNRVIIRAGNAPIKLVKFMSEAVATYEALRLQRLPIFERGLMRVGQQFMIQITDFGIATAWNGDGNTLTGPAISTVACTGSSVAFSDVLSLEFAFTMGYEVEDGLLIAPAQVIQKLLNLAEFKDPLAGGKFTMAGTLPTPLGHPLIRWDSTGKVPNWSTTQLMHLKPGLTMIKYTEGGLLVETDRIIDAQWDISVASTWTGFGIWDRNACRALTGC